MKKSVIIIAALIIIAGALAAILLLSPASENDISALLSAGEKYLAEMNYEQAIIEFEKLIAIEPKNADNWLKLAEAYERSGQPDKAVQTLKKALENVDDDRIRMKLAELELLLNPQETTAAAETAAETDAPETWTEEFIYEPELESSSERCLAIEQMLYDYYNNGGSIDGALLADVTELEIYGDKVFFVSCGEEKGKRATHEAHVSNHGSYQTIEYSSRDGSDQTDISYEAGNITDISFVKYCSSLESLRIVCNGAVDLSPLSLLDKLEGLYISHVPVSDISVLAAMPGLKELTLDNTAISDVSPVCKCTGLVELDIRDCGTDALPSLSALTFLESLELDGFNSLPDMSGLLNMKYLSTGNVKNISGVEALENLERLDIGWQVEDISMLPPLKKLEALSTTERKPEDIEAISRVTSLKWLELDPSEPYLPDFSPLASLTGLETLYIFGGNDLFDYTPFGNIGTLKHLSIYNSGAGGNHAMDLTFLSKLDRLEELELIRAMSYDSVLLPPLDCCPLLRRASFPTDWFTEENLAEFTAAHPYCYVEYGSSY